MKLELSEEDQAKLSELLREQPTLMIVAEKEHTWNGVIKFLRGTLLLLAAVMGIIVTGVLGIKEYVLWVTSGKS